ncbi:MAG: universal stress protein [Dehalococcoidia bacterium]|nr:universal stress protein [Dehalococcoidia bacterium]
MFNKIMVPLDGSVLAETSIPYAIEVARSLQSNVILAQVEESGQESYRHMYEIYMKAKVHDTAQALLTSAGESEADIPRVESVTLCGDAATTIADYAGIEKIDLIAISTHGRSGIGRWALGSVSDHVVRIAGCPVLLIRQQKDQPKAEGAKLINRVLVMLDGSAMSESILPYIEHLAVALKWDVTLLRVVNLGDYVTHETGVDGPLQRTERCEPHRESARDYLEKIAARLAGTGISVKCEVRFGLPADEIIDFAKEMRADLVAMCTHGRSGVSRWALGSTAEKVLSGGTIPLLLVQR